MKQIKKWQEIVECKLNSQQLEFCVSFCRFICLLVLQTTFYNYKLKQKKTLKRDQFKWRDNTKW